MESDELVRRKSPLWPSTRDGAAARQPAAPAGGEEEAGETGREEEPDSARYEAYKAVDRDPFGLSIYTFKAPANAHPAYHFYQYMLDDKAGKIFDIVYGFFVVRVRGRNLGPVIRAIKSRKCVFIQEYQHRTGWPEPTPEPRLH